MRHVRNAVIVLALAAAVAFLPAAGVGASFLGWLLGVVFLGSLGWFLSRLYREYRATLYGLGDRNRGLLYGAFGLIALTLTATPQLWDSGIGSVAWFALLAVAGLTLFVVYRAARAY